MPEDIRFYVGGKDKGVPRRAAIKRLAKELFDDNASALINFAINQTFGLDPETGERLPDAPVFNKQPPLYAIRPGHDHGHSMTNDAPTKRAPAKRAKRNG